MDGIPVMSRAACRNHAVHTLGCVNQTAHEVARGKGNHGIVGYNQTRGQVRIITATCVETREKSYDVIVAYRSPRSGSSRRVIWQLDCSVNPHLRYTSNRRSIFGVNYRPM